MFVGNKFLELHGAILNCGNHALSFGTKTRFSIPISFTQHATLSQGQLPEVSCGHSLTWTLREELYKKDGSYTC